MFSAFGVICGEASRKADEHARKNGRIEETRTPDPHVPNVVRYQLRYYPKARHMGRMTPFCALRVQRYD